MFAALCEISFYLLPFWVLLAYRAGRNQERYEFIRQVVGEPLLKALLAKPIYKRQVNFIQLQVLDTWHEIGVVDKTQSAMSLELPREDCYSITDKGREFAHLVLSE